MNKKKTIILTLLLFTIILSISMASAADTDNNQTTDTITEQPAIESTTPVQNEVTDTDTKEITKSNKEEVKQASATKVDVNNYNELVSQVNKIQQGTQKEYTINLKPGNYNATANMTLEQNNGINYKVTINGNNITLDGQKKYTFIKVTNCSLELKNIRLENFKTNTNGIINITSGNLNIINSTLNNNNAKNSGGAISTYYSNCTITNTNITNNTASGFRITEAFGGAIYIINSNCNITQSTLNNNQINSTPLYYQDYRYGGAIYTINSTCNITQSTLNNNTSNYGGAIYSKNTTFTITNTNLTNNTANRGGAIYLRHYSNFTITNTNLTNNTATYDGGAIYNGEILNINNSTLANNTARSSGGAIYTDYLSNCNITNTTLNNNTSNYGGAIYTYGWSTNCNITNTTLNNNYGKYGGAIYNDSSRLIIKNSIFKNNKADEENNIYNAIGKTTIYLNNISEKNYRDLITIQGQIRVNGNKIVYQNLNITILINDEKINLTTDYKGKFSTKIQLNSTGKYIIKALFNGKGKYLPSNATISFNVTKRNTTIKTKVEDAFLNNPVTIKGNLTDKTNTKLRNANIYITINKEKYHILTDANGTYTLNYTPTTKGTNNITITYKGNKNYQATNITTTFEVDKDLIIKSTYYRDNITIKALITENNKPQKNKNVKLTINNETTTIKTDENGIIEYTIKSTTAGTNTLKITYNNKTTTQTFTTQKRNTTITATTPKTATINKQITIKGNLTDQSNTKLRNANIYITINNEKYHILTDANGTYTLNYTPTTKGTYNITIQYKGNKNYQATNTTRTLKVS
ncbi:MAG: hypothetical protein E7Z75_09690 [Methanobrevibacter olleyae]|uniref:Big-1 domain-containing protein n=1 Tax=Methanobrevibacter olleyae TaxID=294671 RepID=A0A8T3VTM8_METOL|nr:hypothetical protein [Methanobrevibacter olleyae]